MNNILVGCKTAWRFTNRRSRCMRTWFNDIVYVDSHRGGRMTDAVFTFGVADLLEPTIHGDWLFLPAPDGYDFLPQRMRWFCQWACQQKWWDYLFCMDDDTRLSVPRLMEYETNGADYIGPEWKPGVGYASGGGHFLSRRAAEAVAEKLIQPIGADDLLVGLVLRQADIKLTVDNQHFKVLMPPDAEPGPDNNWVYAVPKGGHGQDEPPAGSSFR